ASFIKLGRAPTTERIVLTSAPLQLSDLDRGAQGSVDLQANLLSVANRGDEHGIRSQLVDRAWWPHDQAAPPQPLLRGVIVDYADHVESYFKRNRVRSLHDFPRSVEDHAFHAPPIHLTERRA